MFIKLSYYAKNEVFLREFIRKRNQQKLVLWGFLGHSFNIQSWTEAETGVEKPVKVYVYPKGNLPWTITLNTAVIVLKTVCLHSDVPERFNIWQVSGEFCTEENMDLMSTNCRRTDSRWRFKLKMVCISRYCVIKVTLQRVRSMMMFNQVLYLLKFVLPILFRKAWMLGNMKFISRVQPDIWPSSSLWGLL